MINRNGRIDEAGGGEDDDGSREDDENLSHDQVFDGLKDSVKYNNSSLFRRNVTSWRPFI